MITPEILIDNLTGKAQTNLTSFVWELARIAVDATAVRHKCRLFINVARDTTHEHVIELSVGYLSYGEGDWSILLPVYRHLFYETTSYTRTAVVREIDRLGQAIQAALEPA